jgi:PAS domain S-box-containing protein
MAGPSDPTASHRDFEHLVATCPIAIAGTDDCHRVGYCNAAFESLFHYRLSEALGRQLETLVGLTNNEEATRALGRVSDGESIQLTMQVCRKDRSPVDVEFHAVPRAPTGPFVGFWALFQDISGRRHLEHLLRVLRRRFRKLTRNVIEAQEWERLRIARDLHDDIGQRMVSWQLAIDRVRRDLSPVTPQLDERIEELQKQARSISADLQALSHELHSPALTLLSIDKSLKRLCDDMSTRLGLHIDFNGWHVPRSIPPNVSLCLFRVLQEALTNVVKHSGTTRAVVRLIGTPDAIALKVRDFGSGVSPHGLATTPGLGLTTMRERVAMVHGTLAIISPPGGGTEIEVRVPIETTEAT